MVLFQNEKGLYALLQKKQTSGPSSSIILSQKQRTQIIANQNSLRIFKKLSPI